MKKNSNFLSSIICALSGIFHVFKHERNFRFHIFFSILVLLLSFITKLSCIELCIILIMIMIVLILEIVNTIFENIMDILYIEYNINAKLIKDISAGAVLISAFISVIVGLIIFIPKFIFI